MPDTPQNLNRIPKIYRDQIRKAKARLATLSPDMRALFAAETKAFFNDPTRYD
jgi:hypothetical protein